MTDVFPFDFGDGPTENDQTANTEQQTVYNDEPAQNDQEIQNEESKQTQDLVNDDNPTKDVPEKEQSQSGLTVHIKNPGEAINIASPEKKDESAKDQNENPDQNDNIKAEEDSNDHKDPNKQDEKPEDPQAQLFGEQNDNTPTPVPENTVDEYKYNLLQQQYQEHLKQVQQEIETALEGLQKLGTEFRENYKKTTLEQIEQANKKQQEEWEEMQKILQDEKTSSWDKIGRLTQAGTGRAYEVLRARVSLAQKTSEEQKGDK